MQTSTSASFGLFLTTGYGVHPYSKADIDRLERGLVHIPGVAHTHLYTPASASDPYLDDGAPPALMLECAFTSIDVLEASLIADGALAALFGTVPMVQQAMVLRHFAVPSLPPSETCCTYVVTYDGEADDANAWLSHYLAHHPAIMGRFPGIRGIMVASRMDWCSGVAWPRANALQRNRVVFDDAVALDGALASPVRHEMRADFRALPPFHGRVTHFPMHTRTIAPTGALTGASA